MVTEQDVRNHIGMTTNVTMETRAHWLKRIVGDEMDRLAHRFTVDASPKTV